MKKVFFLSVVALLFSACSNGVDRLAGLYENVPFVMQKVAQPSIPEYKVSIEDFGAKQGGSELCTEAFAKAIAELQNRGGGVLDVPAGLWLTGPIVLCDNMELRTHEGTLIQFTDDRSKYPLVESSFEGLKTLRCQSPLSATGKHDIAITGKGIIDGNGGAWRPVKRNKLTDNQWKKFCSQKGSAVGEDRLWFPNERIKEVYFSKSLMDSAYANPTDTAIWNYVHDFLRPALIAFTSCDKVKFEDVTFQNSPGWNCHPLMCTNLTLDGVNIRNPWFAQNGDGLDAESCGYVLVNNCTFDVGDDAICIKSGKDAEGRKRGMPTHHVIVKGCTVYHGHGGFVVGSEMSGGANNIYVKDCIFLGTDVGLRFKSTRGRGGVVEDIWIDGVSMMNIPGEALLFDLYYGLKPSDEVPEVTEETPSFRKIYVNNVNCLGASKAMFFNGLPEMPVKQIEVSNSYFEADKGAVLNSAEDIKFSNVVVKPAKGEAFVTNNVKNFINN